MLRVDTCRPAFWTPVAAWAVQSCCTPPEASCGRSTSTRSLGAPKSLLTLLPDDARGDFAGSVLDVDGLVSGDLRRCAAGACCITQARCGKPWTTSQAGQDDGRLFIAIYNDQALPLLARRQKDICEPTSAALAFGLVARPIPIAVRALRLATKRVKAERGMSL
jgi:hypothetical protein